MDRNERLAAVHADAAIIKAECPDDVAVAWRNLEATNILSHFDSDARRIRHLAFLAEEGQINPHNPFMHLDLAEHFSDPAMVSTAQKVAEYATVPRTRLGKAERFLRRVVHRDIAQAIRDDLLSK